MPNAKQNCAYHSDNIVAVRNALQSNAPLQLTNPLKDHALWASLQGVTNQKIQQLKASQQVSLERDNARREVTSIKASLQSTQSQLSASQSKVAQLEQSVQRATADVLQAGNRTKALEEQNTQFKTEYDEMKRMYEELQKSVAEREAAFSEVERENQELKNGSSVINSEIENARRKLANIKAEKAKLIQLQEKEMSGLQGVIDKLAHVVSS